MTVSVSAFNSINIYLGVDDKRWEHRYYADAKIEGGTAPFTYVWSVPGTFLGGQGTGAAHFSVTNTQVSGETGWGHGQRDSDRCAWLHGQWLDQHSYNRFW